MTLGGAYKNLDDLANEMAIPQSLSDIEHDLRMALGSNQNLISEMDQRLKESTAPDRRAAIMFSLVLTLSGEIANSLARRIIADRRQHGDDPAWRA